MSHAVVDAPEASRGRVNGDARYRGLADQRSALRAGVELTGQWRPWGSLQAPTLVMFFDLSSKGARVAGWVPLEFDVGDEIELRIERVHRVKAVVARVLGGGEYGVRFVEVSDELGSLLIATVASARLGRRQTWTSR